MPPRKSTSSTAGAKSPSRSPSTSSATSTPSKPRARTKSTSKKVVARSTTGLLSENKYLTYVSYGVASMFIGFGLNAIFRPKEALTFFELDYPLLPKQGTTIDVLSGVYGARDVFVGTAIIIAALLGTRKALAYTLLSASSQAFFDGAIVFVKVGKGQWNHWGYAPLVLFLSVLVMGCLDTYV